MIHPVAPGPVRTKSRKRTSATSEQNLTVSADEANKAGLGRYRQLSEVDHVRNDVH